MPDRPTRREMAAAPLVALATLLAALIATAAAGVPLRDPNGVSWGRLTNALILVAVLIAVDCVIRGRERWPRARLALTGGVALYLAGHAAFRARMTGAAGHGKPVAVAALLGAFALTPEISAIWVAAVTCAIVAALCAAETVRTSV